MPGVTLRLKTLARRVSLDAALAEGADPARDPALALRARQLTEPATCRAIASTIRNLIDAAEAPKEAWSAGGPRPPLQSDGVLAARGELLAVADLLCEGQVVSPQTAALAARLVWDAASPVYAATDFSVWEWAQAVLDRPASECAAA